MPKGKKFNAAEKHFMEKEQRIKKEITELRLFIQSLYEDYYKLQDENARLTNEAAQMHDWIERLLEYTELSKDDIKRACKKDAEMAGFLSTFKMLTKYL